MTEDELQNDLQKLSRGIEAVILDGQVSQLERKANKIRSDFGKFDEADDARQRRRLEEIEAEIVGLRKQINHVWGH